MWIVYCCDRERHETAEADEAVSATDNDSITIHNDCESKLAMGADQDSIDASSFAYDQAFTEGAKAEWEHVMNMLEAMASSKTQYDVRFGSALNTYPTPPTCSHIWSLGVGQLCICYR